MENLVQDSKVIEVPEEVTGFNEVFGVLTNNPEGEPTPEEKPPVDEKPPEVIPTEDKPPVEAKPVEQNFEDLYRQELQKTKSWEGRLSAQARQIKDLETALAEVKAKPAAPVVTDTKPAVPLVDENDPLIQGFITEMGEDFIKPLDAYMQKKLDAALDKVLKPYTDKLSLLDKLPTLEAEVHQTAEEKRASHYGAIYDAHPDVAELMEQNKVNEYIEALPYKDAIEAKRVIDKGSTKEVIGFLTKMKTDLGIIQKVEPNPEPKPKPKPKTPIKEVVDENVSGALAVKHTSTFVPKGQADKDDFEGSFAEAVAQR